jgi:RHS repeat-associated protein
MKIRTSALAKISASILVLAVTSASIPGGAAYAMAPDPNRAKPYEAPAAVAPRSRMLTGKSLTTLQGRTGPNPYLAGSQKYSASHNGVDLITGNFSTSGTDLTFEATYGIAVNVTRVYSANDANEGPLGPGWTMSVDARSTAGGIMKGSRAPVRSVPVSFKERPAVQDDPHIPTASEPVEAVVSTDASGQEETIQRDVDGVLTTPPWDKNTVDTTYEMVTVGGASFQVQTSNVLHTADGTTYVYAKKGAYPNGTHPWDDPLAAVEASNVLKPLTATDRHGNVTTYSYSTATADFDKINGLCRENKISSIAMPNGHTITFTWGNGTNAPTNRIRTASDGVRTVTYGYDTHGCLSTVTTPAGRVTTYGYSNQPTGDAYLLTSITDPRGMATTISYAVFDGYAAPFGGPYDEGVFTTQVTLPSGVTSYFEQCDPTDDLMTGEAIRYTDRTGGSNGPILAKAFLTYYSWPTVPELDISMYDTRVETDVMPFTSPLVWRKTHDVFTQDLLRELHHTYPWMYDDLRNTRLLNSTYYRLQTTQATIVYNFMGAPLHSQTVQGYIPFGGGQSVTTATNETDYAYWGANKYWLQKAVRNKKDSTTWRYSYTDYFDDQATTGKKGQTYRVYDDKRADFNNTSGSTWRYDVVPVSVDTHSAEFDYDSKGRPVDTWKLQSTTSTPWTYVRTHTTYGADTDGSWGAATTVVEDYGTGKTNRTTQTTHYDSAGRADRVVDSVGHEFQTSFDADGQVQSMYRIDGGLNQPIVSYVYGSSGITNGVPTQLTDGLSGVVQSFTYYGLSNGGATGQLASVQETNGTDTSTVSYTYHDAGDRNTATYATPDGTTRWRYSNYLTVGSPESASRTFQTLNQLNSSSASTAEEFHYQFDASGRLSAATFAMSPQTGTGAPATAPYYTSDYPAATRARAYYAYDPAGRTINVEHYWDVWTSESGPPPSSYYASEKVLANACTYDPYLGLKSSSSFYAKNATSNTWDVERTETYGYDADLDYLTSASYGDGLANANVTWTYDAAGNRASDSSNTGTWVYDNLNRMTASPGVTYTNDILGNRTSKGTVVYGWDELNRLRTHPGTVIGQAIVYGYRADGMRVSKGTIVLSTSVPIFNERYRYDGQMPIETSRFDYQANATTVYRNGVGGRGIDYQSSTTSTGTSVTYPVYDEHGNMVATLAKSSGGYQASNRRAYDAWGRVRQGSTSGQPTGRYCASLGHVQDDESGLVYMRARYYEPTSGRFISQDPQMEGGNWLVYADNDPINLRDASGRSVKLVFGLFLTAIICFVLAILFMDLSNSIGEKNLEQAAAKAQSWAKFNQRAFQGMNLGEVDWKDVKRFLDPKLTKMQSLSRSSSVALKYAGYMFMLMAVLACTELTQAGEYDTPMEWFFGG